MPENRTLIVGDVHGCSAEFSALLDRTQPTSIVLVGDLFTKGPDPGGVYSLIRETGARSVLGNHDDRLLRPTLGDGSDPHADACAAALERVDVHWRRWVAGLPLFIDAAGWTVVHAGIHPSGDRAKTTRRQALKMRRYPDDAHDDPPWWTLYRGASRIVFGHDARQGWVRRDRDGEPWIIGLDTGCVYGGALSGWLVERQQLVQVPAQKAWCPVGTNARA